MSTDALRLVFGIVMVTLAALYSLPQWLRVRHGPSGARADRTGPFDRPREWLYRGGANGGLGRSVVRGVTR